VKYQKFILLTKINVVYMEEQKLSSGSQEKRADLLGELRQLTGLGASFFRVAARIGMTVTDMQVIDLLDSTGPTTAGRLAPGKDEMHEISSIFDSIGKAWDEMASHYDDEQIAFLLEFLKRSNTMSRKEFVRLREAPEGEGGSSPLRWESFRAAGSSSPPGSPG
jgi:hypothetical protein